MKGTGSDEGSIGLAGWLRPANAEHDGCWRVVLGNPDPAEVSETLGSHRLVLRSGYCCGFHATWTNYPHHHGYYEICLVVGGSGEYVHGDQRFDLAVGDVFLADPAVTHEISSRRSRDLSLVFFTFRIDRAVSRSLPGDQELLGAFLAGHRIHAAGQRHLFHYLPLLEKSDAGGRNREFAARRAMTDLVLEMIAGLTSPWSPDKAEARPASTLDLALDYLQRNVSAGVGVKDMASYACTSERTLRRLFRQHLGRSIQEEIRLRKAHYAAGLLASGAAPAEIARRLGLHGPASLSRLFKSQTGLTPAMYRRLHSGPALAASPLAEKSTALADSAPSPAPAYR